MTTTTHHDTTVDAPACDCISNIEQLVSEKVGKPCKAQVALTMSGGVFPPLMEVRTEKGNRLVSKVRGTYCPFCGVKYGEPR